MITLDSKISELTKGPNILSRLKKLELNTVADLLYHFPARYDDFSQIKKINELEAGQMSTVKGKIELLSSKRSKLKKIAVTECFLSDETGSIKAIWFGQPFIIKNLHNGDEVYFSGETKGDLFNLYLQNPSYERYSVETTHTARLVPIYPLTEGLTQKQLRWLIKKALDLLTDFKDPLPKDLKQQYALENLEWSINNLHFPENQTALKKAERRIGFDELLTFQLTNLKIKEELQTAVAPIITFQEEATKKIVSGLGFQLTNAQKRAAWRILQDLEQNTPMNRLLEGDVGSGKTVVAGLALASTALNGLQGVILAPTEILASQHFQSLTELLATCPINIGVFSRGRQAIKLSGKEAETITKAKMITAIANGTVQILVATHAVLQDKINFKNLGLVVIDEQHRFGVEQRQILKTKATTGMEPHILSMTATPIPRTLALALYGELNVSILDELPPNRLKPITKLVSVNDKNQAYEFVLGKIKEGRQAFVICPLVEESDKLGVKAVTSEQEKLKTEIFPQLNIGLMHGRLKPQEKESVMKDFAENKLQILVATSVVEVGVNVPNASVILIESAERFGLSQLHQFRGRVNRSHHQPYCLLFSEHPSQKSFTRLQTLVNCFDGFRLAEEDLKQRGAGRMLGNQQSGFFSLFQIANINDQQLIADSRTVAQEIIKNRPNLLADILPRHSFNSN
jgi:ATP-dependent DNA helicase RecG